MSAPAAGNLMHGRCRSWRTRARSAGQCRRLLDAAPNPGSPDTSYGIAGARDWRSCDQASLQRAAQKGRDEKGPGLVGQLGPLWVAPRDLSYNKSLETWPPPLARPRAEARGGCPPPPSHPLEGGRRAGPIILRENKYRERERER